MGALRPRHLGFPRSVFHCFTTKIVALLFGHCTQFHMDILNELDNENGIVRSPYFLEGCYVVYSIKNGCLTLWIFQDKIDKYLSIPTYYICVSPKDKIKGEGHQLDCMILPLLDNCMEANLRDYIDMVLDYLCLRQWAEVQLGKVASTVKKEIKKNYYCPLKVIDHQKIKAGILARMSAFLCYFAFTTKHKQL